MNGIQLGQIALNGSSSKVLKRLHRAFDPTCGFYLARTRVDQKLHHVVAINWMTEEVVLCDPETQAPPTSLVAFDAVEIVARKDNPEQPGKMVEG
jgi:hypothetical protein